MRLKGGHEDVDSAAIQSFFAKRISKFKDDNPYAVTMLNDNNPELVRQRNAKEVEKLLPLLKLDKTSKVLDIACGIGRWSDAIKTDIKEYCGIDFCEELISKAKELNTDKSNRFFYIGKCNEIEHCLRNNNKGKYDRVLLTAVLLYLNDSDVDETFAQVCNIVEENAIILVKESIGLSERLTLKEYFSDELNDTYNAIYRTRDELVDVFDRTLFKKGFKILEEGFLFDESLNNRKETAQYYFVLER